MKSIVKKRPNAIIACLFVILFLIGFFTCDDYGAYFDQYSEQYILRHNLMEYTLHLLGEDSEAAAYYRSVNVAPITQTKEIDHGQAAFYPLAPLMTLMDTDLHTLSTLWHIMAWLWFMVGVLALYGLCRKLGLSRVAAFAGAMLLYLSPRFFAEGHYNNKDMVLLSLTLLTLYTGVCLWQKPTIFRALLFSLAGAVCANTKIIGVCVWGLMGVGAIALITFQKRWTKKTFIAALTAVLSFIIFYFLLTPAMWNDPLYYFQYLISNATGFTRWDNLILFRSMMYRHSVNPLPFYYLPYMVIVTTPLYVVALMFVGQLAMLWYCWHNRKNFFQNHKPLLLVCATLLWFLPIAFAIVTNAVVYNSWRHFYFTFAGMALLAAWGLETLIHFMKTHAKRWQQIACAVMAALCFLTSATGIAMNHPYQYAYYNALGRLLSPTHISVGMELDHWGVATYNALEDALAQLEYREEPYSLNAQEPISLLAVNSAYLIMTEEQQARVFVPYPDETDPKALHNLNDDLIFVNTTYNTMHGYPVPDRYTLLTEIYSYGLPIAQVYKLNSLP